MDKKRPIEPAPSGKLWGRGCILASLVFILFFIFLIAIRSWQVGKSPFAPPEEAPVLERDSLSSDSLVH